MPTAYSFTTLPSEVDDTLVADIPDADIEEHYNKLLRFAKEAKACINGTDAGTDTNGVALQNYTGSGIIDRLEDIEVNGYIKTATTLNLASSVGAAGNRSLRFILGALATWVGLTWDNTNGYFTLGNQAGTLKEIRHADATHANASATKGQLDALTIDSLSDTTITSPASGQGLLYNGSAWVNGAVGSMVLLASATASNSASIDFTSGIDSTYDEYVILFNNVVPATNGAQLYMRVSTNNGSSWESGGTDYGYTSTGLNSVGTAVSIASNGAAWMQIAGTSTADFGLGNAAGRSSRGRVEISLPSSSSINKKLGWKTGWSSEGGTNYLYTLSGEGEYRATTAINGIRFLMSSGNITSGSFYLYGVKKS
jgi:hypothetical protein